MKDLYNENWKIQKKAIEGDFSKMQRPPLFMRRQNIVKMAIVLKAIYRFNKTPSNFNTINRHTETILKFMQQHKIP